MTPAAGRVGIGAVLDALSAEFPDISISKIRYLEAQGLLDPERTAKGFRRYSPDDVERLRFVLVAQRDRFWPLRVIREHLDALDRGLVPSADSSATAAVPPPATPREHDDLLEPSPPLRITAEELQKAAGIDGAALRELVSYGLVRAVDGHYGGSDLEIARCAAELLDMGVEVRHLRPFRTAAEREVGLVEHVRGTTRLRSRAAPGVATDAEVVADVAGACLDLHTALVRAQLARLDP